VVRWVNLSTLIMIAVSTAAWSWTLVTGRPLRVRGAERVSTRTNRQEAAWWLAFLALLASLVVTWNWARDSRGSGSTLNVILAGAEWVGLLACCLVAVRRLSRQAMRPFTWAPDPSGRHQYRCWDGSRWTDKVIDHGIAGRDPVA